MAKLKATPKTFAQAEETFNRLSRGKDSVRLGNNTYLEPCADGFAIRLHATNIVIFHTNGRVSLHTGGWRTITTKERINQFITGRVYQSKHEWYLMTDRGTLGFYEGIGV